MPALPVDRSIDEIVAAVRSERRVIVVAPPGSGKTTRIPPALTSLGRTILLQPRRVAARALARRIAQERGWTVGSEIGWHIRFERRFSDRTQLLVVTARGRVVFFVWRRVAFGLVVDVVVLRCHNSHISVKHARVTS